MIRIDPYRSLAHERQTDRHETRSRIDRPRAGRNARIEL